MNKWMIYPMSDEWWSNFDVLYLFSTLSACSRSLSLSIESHTSSNVFHFPWNSRFRVASSLHHYQSDVVMVFTNNVLNWLISVNLPVFCVQITPSSNVCWYLPRWWQYFTINNIMIWRFEERSIVRDSLETVIIIVLYFHFNFWFWCWIFRSFHRIQRHRTGFANFFFCIRFTQIVTCIYDLAFARSACARRTRIPLLFIFHTSFNCRRFIYLFSVFLVYIKISSLEHAFISHLFSFLSGASFSFKMCALMPVCLFCVRLFVCLMHDWYESEYGWQKDISLQKAS